MKKVLITGASGLLGRYLLKNVPKGYEIASARHANNLAFCSLTIDITNMDDVQRAFYVFKPDIVIHAAAIGAVDYCEKHPYQAIAVNVSGTRNIATACQDFHSKMVLISTNAVFDGTKAPYIEDDPVCPISVYGDTKVAAEDITQTLVPDSLIIRTARLFGKNWPGGRENWVDIIRKAISDKKYLKITTEDVCNPTYAGCLALSIWSALDFDLKGIYHIAGRNNTTMYQFACVLADQLYNHEHTNEFIIPVISKDMPEGIMTRPANTSYCMDKLIASGAFVPLAVSSVMGMLSMDLRSND